MNADAAPKPELLIALSDYPGFFMQTAYSLALQVRRHGGQPIFALTSPFYPRFKNVSFEALGPVYYLSEFLNRPVSVAELNATPIDWWKAYPTFLRTTYYNTVHPNTWDVYKRITLFFRWIFSRHTHVVAVWSEAISSAYLYMCYEESLHRSVPFLGYISARVPAHFNIQTDPYGQFLECPAAPDSIAAADDIPDYMRARNNNLSDLPWKDLWAGAPIRLWRAIPGLWMRSPEIGNYFAYLLRVQRTLFLRKLRFRLISSLQRPFQRHAAFSDDRLAVLLPLQYRPEASTSVLAPHYEEDTELVRNVAFSLPPQATLFVKEHRSAVGIRPGRFYRQILTYPNVELLGIDFDLRRSLANFDAVVTLSSTVGFEAIQRSVRVYLLGRCFYEDYPGVEKIPSWAALREVLSQLSKAGKHLPRPEVIERYLRHCYPGTFDYMAPSVLSPRNIERLAEPVIRAMGLPDAS